VIAFENIIFSSWGDLFHADTVSSVNRYDVTTSYQMLFDREEICIKILFKDRFKCFFCYPPFSKENILLAAKEASNKRVSQEFVKGQIEKVLNGLCLYRGL
jgi:hypothetical protein